MENLKIGQVITVVDKEYGEGKKRRKIKLTIQEIYKGHVLGIDEKGFKRSINKGDLIINKIIKQKGI